ncbi:MAG: hypothetical protein QNI84_03590 [Henriciella sp.]|nr:hypothetical protein [Henriciella sp.]
MAQHVAECFLQVSSIFKLSLLALVASSLPLHAQALDGLPETGSEEAHPPITGTMDVVGMELVEDRGDEARFTLTLVNTTNADFSGLVVSVYPNLTSGLEVRDAVLDIGAVRSGETVTPSPTFTVLDATAGSTGLTDLHFAVDDRTHVDGLDLDKNGLRDDVEVLIEAIVPDENNAVELADKYARSAVRFYRQDTPETANEAFDDVENLLLCLLETELTTDVSMDDITTRILMEISNTDERLAARLKALDLAYSVRQTRAFPSDEQIARFCSEALIPDNAK